MTPVTILMLSADEALTSVGSDPAGLSSVEATRRLREYGPNRIERVARLHPVVRLLREFTQLFSVILWIAAMLSFVADWYDPGQGMAHVGYAIVVVILVSGSFSFWQEFRIERTIAALQSLLPQKTKVLRDGSAAELPAEQIVVGDIVLLEQGDNVPADCRLIEALRASANTATLTGESVPRPLNTNPSQETELSRGDNILLAGTSIVSGRCKAVVFATGARTEWGKIAHLVQTSGPAASPLRRQLAQFSRLIALLSVTIGFIFLAASLLIGAPLWQDVIFSIGIIVAMVPEGLLPTLTLSLVLAAQRMARRNVLIRELTSVETLGFATVICTDKTGTLTANRMRAKEILLGDQRYSASDLAGRPELPNHHRDFFLTAGLCHDLIESVQSNNSTFLGDPMEIALVDMARGALPRMPLPRRIDEIPFDDIRKRLTVVYEARESCAIYCKGALDTVLPLCTHVFSGGAARLLDAATIETIRQAELDLAARGLRVLALASITRPSPCPTEEIEQGLIFQGLVGLEDPPRPEVPEAVRKCHDAGIKIIVVTGDHPLTATAIAREIGVVKSDTPRVITGEQLRVLSDVALALALDAAEIIFARVAPEQKMRIVTALIEKKHVVAVTGDGVNDAPALKAAHIGVAMGLTGSDVAKEASDIVLLDDSFAGIVSAIEEGRAVFQNIRKFLTYVLVHNVAELVPYLAFLLFAIPLPLTPIQALFVDMGTDSLTALGLGVEKPDPKNMQLPPRPQHERLLNLPLALRAYLFLGLMEATAAMAAFFFVLYVSGWRHGKVLAPLDPLYMQATTACLATIIVMQILNVFVCRSSVRSAFSSGMLENRLIFWGVALEIVLLLVAAFGSWGHFILRTAEPPASLWLFLVPFGLTFVGLEEFRKWIVRRGLEPLGGNGAADIKEPAA